MEGGAEIPLFFDRYSMIATQETPTEARCTIKECGSPGVKKKGGGRRGEDGGRGSVTDD